MTPPPPQVAENSRHSTASNNSNNNSSVVMVAMTSDYNQWNQSQSTVWQHLKPLLTDIMQDWKADIIISSNKEPDTTNKSVNLRVADLGCATGGNSVLPLQFMAQQLVSANNKNCHLSITLVDLPSNDWNQVVQTVAPEIVANGNLSPEKIHVNMMGRTFYQSCSPPSSLHLSYSLVAVHWMESYGGDIPSGLYATDPLHVPDTTLLQKWKDCGANDWKTFCQARYVELKPGGMFVGAVVGAKLTGNCDYPWSQVGYLFYTKLQQLGTIPPQVLAKMVLPLCWRTKEEVLAGFEDDTKWTITSCECHETRDPIRDRYEQGIISAQQYAHAVVQAFGAVNNPTCIEGLCQYGNMTTRSEAQAILNQAYDRCCDDIGQDPAKYNLDVAFWYVVARKK